MPQFSIIMPTYNRARFICRAIESVIVQTFTDWELIIIDDGSTDDTNVVVKNYLQDSRIYYLYQTNQERSVSRNNGIAKSKGDFICFLDSDDYYLEYHLNTLYQYIEINNIISGCLYTQSLSETITSKRSLNTTFGEIKNNGIYNILFEALININSICLSRNCFDENKFPEQYILFEDNHLWLRILSKFSLHYITSPTTVTLEHENRTVNTTAENLNKKDKMYFMAVNDLILNYPWVKVSKNDWNYFIALKKLTLAFEALKTHNLGGIYKFTFASISEKFMISKLSKYCKLLLLGWAVALLKIKI